MNVGETYTPVWTPGCGLEMVPLKPPFPPCCVVVLPSATVAQVRGCSRMRGTLVAQKVDSSPGERCAAEPGFPRVSRTPGERCAEEPGYIRPVLVTGPPVYHWVVTGSLLFESPPDVYGLLTTAFAVSTDVVWRRFLQSRRFHLVVWWCCRLPRSHRCAVVRGCAGNGHSPGGTLVAQKVDSSPGERCAAEPGFPRASRTPGERCAEEPGYIMPVLVAGPPV